ncbi:alpha/beta hydrolase (plasmid) [Roseomonas gilardii subsp. gilardii]|uniref:alpha/beta fold hydrolase n=1 Tax=Roseomonas gilardii TaxID=257708 RepID=UPI001FFBC746|nr:alpha/beta hydrolase [Roseomonas gilardii]UPG74702.1 alpha/beta hydrolase [Roseomonas gilardii subsp. gilardii]
MPFASIRGTSLYHEVLGEDGPWVMLSPGGRRSLDEMRDIAGVIADGGCRVLLHDRRNTGRSGVSIEDTASEFEVWADDAVALMRGLGAEQAILAGSSSGCRMSILMALRHPGIARALFLMRPTGGEFAVRRLARRYYTIFIEAAERGGMAEVIRTDHFRDLVEAEPTRADTLLAVPPERFIRIMRQWRDSLEQGLHTPILGATEAELRQLDLPTCIVPGNDNTHSRATGLLLAGIMPDAELDELETRHQDVDIVPMTAWLDAETLGRSLLGFVRRRALTGEAVT